MAHRPARAHLEVFRREPSGWLLTATHEGWEQVRAEPFDVVPLGLGALWLETHVSWPGR
jgi:hypothetical protein